MNRIVLGLAAAACLVLPAQGALAADSPYFADFKRLCVATNASMAKSVAIADGEGWTPVPKSLMPAESTKDLVAYEIRMLQQGSAFQMLFVGQGKIDTEVGKTDVDICFFADSTANAEAVRAETQAFTRLPPSTSMSKGAQTMWSWLDTPTGRKDGESLPDAQIAAAFKAGTIRLVILQIEPGLTMVGYAVPRI